MADSAPALVRRGRRNARYTAISNEIIDHPTLSPEARIALIYLLSKPDDWRLQINDIRRLLGRNGTPCGRNKAYEVIKELKASAYILAVEELRKGRFYRLAYYVFDEPVSAPEAVRAELQARPPAEADGDKEDAARSVDSPHPGFRETVAPPPRSRDTAIRDLENRDLTKDRNPQTPESPPPSPKRRDTRHRSEVVGGFSKLWDTWPADTRPRNRPLAAKRFADLSPAEQRMAAQFANVFRATRGNAGEFAGMLPYLRQKLFAEFVDAPTTDRGHYVITPDRPEWTSWLDHLRAQHSASVVERQAAKGQFLTPTRWPPKTAETASSVPPDTAGLASPADTPSTHIDRTPDGGGR